MKIFRNLLLLVLGILAILYFASGYIMTRMTDAALERLPEQEKELRLRVLTKPEYESAHVAFPAAIVWDRVSLNVLILKKDAWGALPRLSTVVRSIRVTPQDLLKMSFDIRLSGIEAVFSQHTKKPVGGPGPFEVKLEQGELRLPLRWSGVPDGGFSEVLERHVKALVGLILRGSADIPLEFAGVVGFEVEGNSHSIPITSNTEDGKTRLILDRKELKALSQGMKEKLTSGEIRLLSRNPVRAPALLRIRDYARHKAEEAHDRDARVSEDAYKHVLWSFLLTREFGEEFAQLVTDAHELGAKDNTPADHRMDFTNNAIGRRYAIEGHSEYSLLERMMRDPQVVQSPEQFSGQAS